MPRRAHGGRGHIGGEGDLPEFRPGLPLDELADSLPAFRAGGPSAGDGGLAVKHDAVQHTAVEGCAVLGQVVSPGAIEVTGAVAGAERSTAVP